MIKDNELVGQVKLGNTLAFEELVKRHRTPIYFFVVRTFGLARETEDLLQEIFLSAYRSIRLFDPAKASFKTWLFKIAKNQCIDFLRKSKRECLAMDESSIEEVANSKQNLDSALAAVELKEALLCGLSELTAEQRLCLVMQSIDGFSYDEIALVMELPIGTVKSRIFTARKRLLKEISHRYGGDLSCNVNK